MDLVRLAKDLLQSAAETAVSYRPGQAVLRYADRMLWVVEKSARWAVPPALEQEDDPTRTPELIRPLPWVFFLSLLLVLRVTRESLSLVNLVLGQPPVRPADVVTYIQSKRRFLRALKYQGNRNIRARENRPQGVQTQWLSSLNSLMAFTMCFRRPMEYSGNNSSSANDDQMLVVRKKKRGTKEKQAVPTSPTSDENTMERLIEKMVDMYGESSDDSEYTLTNATSIKSDSSLSSNEEGATDVTLTNPSIELISSTPNKSPVTGPDHHTVHNSIEDNDHNPESSGFTEYNSLPTPECSSISEYSLLDSTLDDSNSSAAKEATENLINMERNVESEVGLKKPKKIANGQTPKTSPPTKKVADSTKRRESEVPIVKITPADDLNNTNGSTEGSYSQNKQSSNRARDTRREGQSKIQSPGKSTKLNKAKESKIRAPFWKKSKKC